jgi:hypothetical protein
MDIFFTDLSEAPLPPHEVRIRVLRAEPYPDGRRVKVHLEVDPFQKRPSFELVIIDVAGNEVSTASIVESMLPRLELVMHLRRVQPGGPYTLHAALYYPDFPIMSSKAAPLSDPPGAPAGEPPEPPVEFEPAPIERKLVDTARVQFEAAAPAE